MGAVWTAPAGRTVVARLAGRAFSLADALGLVGQLMYKFAPGRLPLKEAFEGKGDTSYSREIDGPLRDSFMTL
jgi:hypothetical protein